MLTPNYEKIKNESRHDEETYYLNSNILSLLYSLTINFLIWGVVLLKMVPRNWEYPVYLVDSNSNEKVLPAPAAPPPITICAGDDKNPN